MVRYGGTNAHVVRETTLWKPVCWEVDYCMADVFFFACPPQALSFFIPHMMFDCFRFDSPDVPFYFFSVSYVSSLEQGVPLSGLGMLGYLVVAGLSLVPLAVDGEGIDRSSRSLLLVSVAGTLR